MNMMKSLLLLAFLLVLLVPGGCSFATISGQIVGNGVGLGYPNVSITFVLGNASYCGYQLDSEGHFALSPGQSVYGTLCKAGNVLSILVHSGVQDTMYTAILDYTVMPGSNNFGQIEIGDFGFELVWPEASQTINAWPAQFSWKPYIRTGITPHYSLSLQEDETHAEVFFKECEVSISHTFEGTESSIQETGHWHVMVRYELNGLSFLHSKERQVILVP